MAIKEGDIVSPAFGDEFSYSENGLALTKEFEGCKLEAYQDQGGVWTIGWGHTGPEVHEGLTWTQEQADDAQKKDLGEQ